MDAPRDTLRIDRWLWFARFFKTRGLATRLVAAGHVRVNSVKISKPSHLVGAGDTLTFTAGREVRVVRILAPGTRRGPASEAQALYQDLTPAPEQKPPPAPFVANNDRKGRPTKKDRRKFDQSRRDMLE